MAKGGSEFAAQGLARQEVAGEYRRSGAEPPSRRAARVLRMQTKLHQWAVADPGRRFDDLFNLVSDPAFLLVAWGRVAGQPWGADRRGGRASTVRRIEAAAGGGVPGRAAGTI